MKGESRAPLALPPAGFKPQRIAACDVKRQRRAAPICHSLGRVRLASKNRTDGHLTRRAMYRRGGRRQGEGALIGLTRRWWSGASCLNRIDLMGQKLFSPKRQILAESLTIQRGFSGRLQYGAQDVCGTPLGSQAVEDGTHQGEDCRCESRDQRHERRRVLQRRAPTQTSSCRVAKLLLPY